MSGYVPCACRDCFDIAISSNEQPTLCLLCKDAECTPYPVTPLVRDAIEYAGSSGAYECQRTDAYDTEG